MRLHAKAATQSLSGAVFELTNDVVTIGSTSCSKEDARSRVVVVTGEGRAELSASLGAWLAHRHAAIGHASRPLARMPLRDTGP